MLENNYFYQDEYMYFTFNNIHSSKYNLFIQNDIEDLKLYINSDSNVNFVQPQYQTGQYILGTTSPQRPIPLKLAAINLTREDIIELVKWLKVGTMGVIQFDFASDWCFDVVVTSATDPNLYLQDNQLYIISLEVKLSTIYSPYARNSRDGFIVLNNLERITLKKTDNTIFYEVPLYDRDNPYAYINNNILGTFNNSLYIPSIVCESIGKPEQLNYIEYKMRVHYLGDSFSYINLDLSISNNSENAKLDRITLKIDKAQSEYFSSALDITLPNNNNAYPIIQYKGLSNLFFIDNQLPEQALINSLISKKTVSYNNVPLQFSSAHKPIKIQNKEHLRELITGYSSWFVCKAGTPESTNEYYNAQEGRVYPSYIKGCEITYYDQIKPNNIVNDLQSILNRYEANSNNEWFFGFYDSFGIYLGCYEQNDTNLNMTTTLNATDNTDPRPFKTQIVVNCRQYTEVI